MKNPSTAPGGEASTDSSADKEDASNDDDDSADASNKGSDASGEATEGLVAPENEGRFDATNDEGFGSSLKTKVS